MNAIAIAELITLATTLVEKLLPILTKALKSGEISVDQQQQLKAKVDALRAKLESGELGSHWQIPPRA